MSEAILIVGLLGLVVWAWLNARRQQADPLRPALNELAGRVSASCDYSDHDRCGYPGPLFFSRNGRCECPCHEAGSDGR